jgi:hypothetical protein
LTNKNIGGIVVSKNMYNELNEIEERDNMNIVTNASEYRSLDFSKIKFSSTPMSTEESLKDVEPIKWAKDILTGGRKAIIKKTTKK